MADLVLLSASDLCVDRLKSLLLNSSYNFSPYFDATGKFGSSFLAGNRAWLGDYSSCQHLTDSLYCLADLSIAGNPPDRENFSSTVVRWGFCAVSSCNESLLEHNTPELALGVLNVPWIDVLNSTVNCAKSFPRVTGFYFTLSLLLLLFLICIIATIFDLWYRFTARMRWKLVYSINRSGPQLVSAPPDPEWREEASSAATVSSDETTSPCEGDRGSRDNGQLLNGPPDAELLRRAYCFRPGLKVMIGQCFSFYSNIQLMSVRRADDIVCLHAIRVLSFAVLVLGQTYLVAFLSGLAINPGEFQVIGQRISFQPVACCFYAVDSLLLISGLLSSYNGLGHLRQTAGKFHPISWILHRYVRFAPSVGILLLVWMYIRPIIGRGPVWFQTQVDLNNCLNFWWTNFLFVQNFYPTSSTSSCTGWLWYLAIDFQLFCVSCLVLYALHRCRGIWLLILLGACSFAIQLTLFSVFEISSSPVAALLKHPFDCDQIMFWKFIDVILTKPYCRALSYVVGMWLGQHLDIEKATGAVLPLKRWIVSLGWILCIILGISAIYVLFPPVLGFEYDRAANALSGSFGSLAWSVAIAWCIYACRHLCAGPLNIVFSWTGWVILSRLTFGAFLFHGVLVFSYFDGLHQAFHVSDVSMVSVYLMILAFSFLASLLLFLLVESPVSRILAKFRN